MCLWKLHHSSLTMSVFEPFRLPRRLFYLKQSFSYVQKKRLLYLREKCGFFCCIIAAYCIIVKLPCSILVLTLYPTTLSGFHKMANGPVLTWTLLWRYNGFQIGHTEMDCVRPKRHAILCKWECCTALTVLLLSWEKNTVIKSISVSCGVFSFHCKI